MKVHIIIPYSVEKNLGLAYNTAMSLIPDEDWACILDYDVMLLTPDAGKILHEYAEQNKDAALLTCKTNRIHQLAKEQLLNVISSNTDILYHMKIAEQQKKYLYQTTSIKGAMSGFLMLLPKKTWNEFKFLENGGCLGIDSDYKMRLQKANKKILLMQALYVWHSYRLGKQITDKSHLTQ